MTYGIIPIVSDVGDYTKLYLHDGIDSIFIHANTASGVLTAIEKALNASNDSRKKMRERARKKVETEFDYRNWVAYIKRAIQEIGGCNES